MAESMLQVFYRFSSFLNIHIWNRKEECYLKHVQDKLPSLREHWLYTVPKLIDFPQFNMKCSGGNVMLRGRFCAVSGFPLYLCYIAEIWIAFLTMYSDKDWVSRGFVGGGFCVALSYCIVHKSILTF